MDKDWFEDLVGFKEETYEGTRSKLDVQDGRLRSSVNKRSWSIGELQTPTVGDLRERARAVTDRVRGPLKVSCVVADVGHLHRDAANQDALFQVASQFNLLEMTGPEVTPEDGVTRYVYDAPRAPVAPSRRAPQRSTATTSCRLTVEPGRRERVRSTAYARSGSPSATMTGASGR
jgi:hypothetical protein